MSRTLLLSSPTTRWLDAWRSLMTRIGQLAEHAHRFVESTSVMGSDFHGLSNKMFIPQLQQVHNELKAFLQSYGTKIPSEARTRLEYLLETGFEFYRSPSGPPGMIALATSLSIIRTEVDPFMHDTDLPMVHIAERAFLHLQRLIVADADVRAKWQRAFAAGEVECEKLGGVQLLHHGIYAVKSNAAGERTDLVLGTRFALTPKIQRSVDAMALTEWKLVRGPARLDAAVEDARGQATRYATGSLAGFEISSVRFLVTVSEDMLDEKQDETIGAAAYRHVNIAVNPTTPSRS
jgi:hypothetical protein